MEKTTTVTAADLREAIEHGEERPVMDRIIADFWRERRGIAYSIVRKLGDRIALDEAESILLEAVWTTLTDLVKDPAVLGSIRDLAAYLFQAAQAAAWDADQSSGRLACSKSVYRIHSRIRVLRRELEAKAAPAAELEERIITEFNRTRNSHDIILTLEKLRAVPTEIGTIDGLEVAAESVVEAEAERGDRIATIRALVERCSDGQPELAKEAFKLRWLEGLSVTDTAVRLNVTAVKVKALTKKIYSRFAAEATALRLAGAL